MINRRAFLTGSLLYSAFPLALAQEPTTEVHCDVLIVGAGAAGLFAAISAKENGAKRVVLIEKNPSPFFSSSSYSAGSVNAAGTLAQKEFGIDDSDGLEEFKQELFREGNGKNDPQLVDIYVKNAALALNWFTERGVKLVPAPNIAFHKMRMHGCDRATGAQYVEILFAEAMNSGVNFCFNTRATKLLTRTPNAVNAIETISGNRKIIFHPSIGIVLATGGFAGDLDRIDKEVPAFAGAPTFSSPSSRGEGLDMAKAIGAATHLLSYAGAYAYGFSLDEETRRGLIFRGHVMNLYGSISLNRFGERFINDDLNSTKVAQKLSELGEKTVYQLATQKQLQTFLEKDPIQVIGWDRTKFEQELEEGKYFVHQVDSLEEAASLMLIGPSKLIQTVKRYNEIVRSGVDVDFGRSYLNGGFYHGPFYLFKGTPVVGITIGGLKVNENLQVLNEQGDSIKGLFAAGEVVGGLHGTSYIGGSSLAGAMTLGRFAGQKIMALAKS